MADPRQTPKSGILRSIIILIVSESLKSLGRPGPGESTTSVGWRVSSCAGSKPKRSVVT